MSLERLDCPICGDPMQRSEFAKRPKGKFAAGARFQCKVPTHSVTVYVLTEARAEKKSAQSRAEELLQRADRLGGKEAA